MSERRSLTNLAGNSVATLVVAKWEGELDAEKLQAAMAHPVAIGDAIATRPLEEVI